MICTIKQNKQLINLIANMENLYDSSKFPTNLYLWDVMTQKHLFGNSN